MNRLFVGFLLTLTLNVQAQKVYLTREAVIKLKVKLDKCNQTHIELSKTKLEVVKLQKYIKARDSLFTVARERLDIVIYEAEVLNEQLIRDYNRVLRHVPKRKRKLYNLQERSY